MAIGKGRFFEKGEKMIFLTKEKNKMINNRQGQGLMEYLIISGLVAIFCLASLRELGKVLDKRAQVLRSKIVDNLKTE